MPRRTATLNYLLGLCLAASLCAAAGGQARAADQRPNLLFVLIDDLRWNALGCMGHPFVKTPHIDRIAREGALFRNAFVTLPLCSPSRASFLTGQYAHRNGIRDNTNRGPRSHELITFPRLLQKAGYETAYIGKWHMGNDDTPRPGFDRWVSFKGQGVYQDCPLNVDGQPQKSAGYITDVLTDRTVEFLRRKHDRPFCVTLAHKAIHGPFTPAPRHAELYANDPIQRTPGCRDTNEGKPVLTRPVTNPMGRALPPARPGGGSGDMLIRNQLRCLASIDEGVGRVLDALRETGQLDRTMVVFTSDNGYFWGEHGLGDKRAAYEEALRIPMLVRYPPLAKAGSEVREAVLNVDLAPTFLELGGAAIPEEVQGRSFADLLRGRARDWRASALFEYFEERQFPRIPTWQAVRSARWKYIHYPAVENADELYDLQADPDELHNRIRDAAAAGALQELKAELERLAPKDQG